MTRQTLIKYFFAIVIIIFTFWNRFLRERTNTNNFLPLWLTLLFNIIIFFLVLLYLNLRHILKISQRSKWVIKALDSYVIKRIEFFIKEYILQAPEFFYNDFTKNRDLQPLLEMHGSYFTAYCYYPKIIVIVFFQLPVIVVASMFLIDHIFFNNLNHFFVSLILLIPFLFMKIWVFVLFSCSKRRLDNLSQYLIIYYIENQKQYRIILKPDHELPILEEFPISQIKAKFNVLCNFWEIYSKIYGYMNQIYHYRYNYDTYVQIYTSFCFLIGWVIQLYHTILHLY